MSTHTESRAGVPRQRSSFVGREDEIVGVLTKLETAPMVTLTGLGGVGKTRLAYEVAAGASGDDTDVHVVQLADTSDDDAVVRVVADALGLPVQDTGARAAVTASLCGEGRVLLVLDNCEQVVEGVASLVDHLLSACSGLVALCTSREPLGVDGEFVWPVQPLAVSAGPDQPESPAVQLLRERMDGIRADRGIDREYIQELAARLDGVPLALELAASRLATMGPADLLEQLDENVLNLSATRRGSAERHHSLSATIEWSYHLLPEHEQRVLCGLAVFVGGFTRQAAVDVLGPDASDALDHLAETSLVIADEQAGGIRFRLLEMIREFADGRLADSGRVEEIRTRHAAWAASTTAELQLDLRGPGEGAAADRYELEMGNVGAALRWAIDRRDFETVETLVVNLQDLVFTRGTRELHAWLDDAADAVADEPGHGDVAQVAAVATIRRGDIALTTRRLEEADRSSTTGVVWFNDHGVRGTMAMFAGRSDEAIELFRQWVADADHEFARTFALVLASLPLSYSGRSVEALQAADRALESAASVGNPTLRAWAGYARGEALVGLDPSRALEAYSEACDVAISVDSSFLTGLVIVARASAIARHGEPSDALVQFLEAIRRWRSIGAWSFLSTTLRNAGELLARLDRASEAAMIRAGVAALDTSSEVTGVDEERDRYLTAMLRERLGPDGYDAAVARGTQLTRDEITELAESTLADELRARRSTTEFRAIVFTDLESSTEFLADRGDEQGRAVMRRYDVQTTKAMQQHRGRRIKGTGDGVLATFPTVTEALRFLTDLFAWVEEAVASGDLPLRLRAGVHAGEAIDDMDDVHGTVVNLTARVVDKAGGGEILVTDTVRQIVIGSDFDFAARDEVELKGIPGRVRLHELQRS